MNTVKFILLFGAILILCSFSIPPGWFESGSSPNSYEMGLEEGVGRDGGNAATIKSIEKRPSGFGTLMQQCEPAEFWGKRIKMTGYVRSESVKNSAALWLRVDRGAKPVSFDNMSNRPIHGTTDWKKYELVLDVPADATLISYGALVNGAGQIWFDDLVFEIVDSTVLPTGQLNSDETSKKTEPSPKNLDFEQGLI